MRLFRRLVASALDARRRSPPRKKLTGAKHRFRRLLCEHLEDRRVLAYAANDYYQTYGNQSISGDPLGNDSYNDVSEGCRPSSSVSWGPSYGSLDATPNDTCEPTFDPPGLPFTYTPNPAFIGTDWFGYALTDIYGTSWATVTIDVMNRQPEAPDAYFSLIQDTALQGSLPITDSDGHSVTVTLSGNVAYGILDLSPDGTFNYAPSA